MLETVEDLCTDSQSGSTANELICIRLYCYSGLPRINIGAEYMDKLRSIVKPHMIPFSMYKLSGKVRAESG